MPIKNLREKTGLSQSRFAKVVGMPLSSLQHWEQERMKPPEYVVRWLEKALRYDGVLK